MIKRIFIFISIIFLTTIFIACGNPEEKKTRFFSKGEALYEKGDLTNARLEFKNALQLDPKFAKAYYMLGKVELKDKDFKKAFGSFSRQWNWIRSSWALTLRWESFLLQPR